LLKLSKRQAKRPPAEIKALLDALAQVTLPEKILEKIYRKDFILSGAGKTITIIQNMLSNAFRLIVERNLTPPALYRRQLKFLRKGE
jgi:hypothetical protein